MIGFGGALYYSLYLSHTIWDLKFSWSTLGGFGILGFLKQEGKGRVGKCKKESGSEITSDFLVGTKLHVCFLH